jgi:hypothetical protein
LLQRSPDRVTKLLHPCEEKDKRQSVKIIQAEGFGTSIVFINSMERRDRPLKSKAGH